MKSFPLAANGIHWGKAWKSQTGGRVGMGSDPVGLDGSEVKRGDSLSLPRPRAGFGKQILPRRRDGAGRSGFCQEGAETFRNIHKYGTVPHVTLPSSIPSYFCSANVGTQTSLSKEFPILELPNSMLRDWNSLGNHQL